MKVQKMEIVDQISHKKNARLIEGETEGRKRISRMDKELTLKIKSKKPLLEILAVVKGRPGNKAWAIKKGKRKRSTIRLAVICTRLPK